MKVMIEIDFHGIAMIHRGLFLEKSSVDVIIYG